MAVPPQIPRLYAVYRASGEIDNYEQMLKNIFAPLFEVTRDPESNLPLATFLNTVSPLLLLPFLCRPS